MPKSLSTTEAPEERELRHKQEVLRAKEALLVEKELELSSLFAELLHFRGLYTEAVGRLYVELDQLRARHARHAAHASPDDLHAERRAREAERRAKDSRSEFDAARAETAPYLHRAEPTPDLKETYRRLAKRHHPDLADSEEDVARRTELMAKINAAYAAGDLDALLRIERDAQMAPEAVKGHDVAAELMRTIRKIHQVESRMADIDRRIVDIKRGDDWRLYVQWKQLQENGIDLLEQLCEDLRNQIAAERARQAT